MVTATELVRNFLNSGMGADKKPKEIAELLSKRHKMPVTAGIVSNVKGVLKRQAKHHKDAPASNGRTVSSGLEIRTGETAIDTKLGNKTVPITAAWSITKLTGDDGIADKVGKLKLAAEAVGGVADAMRILEMMKAVKS